jgi:hypothetical protein
VKQILETSMPNLFTKDTAETERTIIYYRVETEFYYLLQSRDREYYYLQSTTFTVALGLVWVN